MLYSEFYAHLMAARQKADAFQREAEVARAVRATRKSPFSLAFPNFRVAEPLSTEQNKAVVRRFIEEGLNQRNVTQVDKLFAVDYVNHLAPGGREGLKKFVTGLFSAFPDLELHFSLEHLIAEGDHVVARITYHITNAGKEATGSDLSEYRIANGKIVEDWSSNGTVALLRQVGVILPSG